MSISFSSAVTRDGRLRGAGVTAVLGPTNTGKTHLAIERMLGHSSGLIGLPLRLPAPRLRHLVLLPQPRLPPHEHPLRRPREHRAPRT